MMGIEDMVVTTRVRLRLRDIYELAMHHVPKASMHEGLVHHGRPQWWPAHELGHLLVAAPSEIGEPYFGLSDIVGAFRPSEDIDHRRLTYARTIERSAMVISRHLLAAAGRADLAEQEREDTDSDTMFWEPGDRIRCLLIARGVDRCPITRAGLEAMILWKMRSRDAHGPLTRRESKVNP